MSLRNIYTDINPVIDTKAVSGWRYYVYSVYKFEFLIHLDCSHRSVTGLLTTVRAWKLQWAKKVVETLRK